MKNLLLTSVLVGLCSICVHAQSNKNLLGRVANAAVKGAQSFTITDAEVIGYANDYMKWSDANNPVCKTTDRDAGKKATAERLEKITSFIPANLIKELNLNIVPYYVVDVNAFACANGDIRIFAGLMDLMTDDEILAVIGHEIGHVANKDSKDAFVTALRVSALKDAASAVGGKTVPKLTNTVFNF